MISEWKRIGLGLGHNRVRRQSLLKVDTVAMRRNMTPMAESDNKQKKHDVQVLLHISLMQCPESRMGGKGGVEDEK